MASPSSSTASAFPERVGKYELLLPLGTGGTATVYLARTRGVAGFEREVALKLVHAHLRADEESRLHLLEEARLAARIRHPNVVSVTEVDSDSCGVFLVMDYVEGETLSSLVRLLRDRNERLPPPLIARIMNDALSGLQAAHELRDKSGAFAGLVHRDFSPQNILIGIEGVARLADFGVAKAASRTVRTKTGLVKGKVAYMSPEQARGHKVDRRCDVWAAGVVIWELITGRKLYDHEDDVATLLSVVTGQPPRLSSVMRDVPRALDDAVASALTSDVAKRCPSAEALRRSLEKAWADCGGMATPAELAAFLRELVGDRLDERRARAARGGGTGKAIETGAAGEPLDNATLPPAPPPEEGTKTAISAAVPTPEIVTPPPGGGLATRWWGITAAVSLVAGVAFFIGSIADGPGEGSESNAAGPVQTPPADSETRGSTQPVQLQARGNEPAPGGTSDEGALPEADVAKSNAGTSAEPQSREPPSAEATPPRLTTKPAPRRKRKRTTSKRTTSKRTAARRARASKRPPSEPSAAQSSAAEAAEAQVVKPAAKTPTPGHLAPDPY